MAPVKINPDKVRAFKDAESFYTWLGKHHDKEDEICDAGESALASCLMVSGATSTSATTPGDSLDDRNGLKRIL
jgi:hypothetical protein